MRLGWERPGSLALRRVLTKRMREYFTYGSVGGAGGNPGSYPAAGQRPGFAGKSRVGLSPRPGVDQSFGAVYMMSGQTYNDYNQERS